MIMTKIINIAIEVYDGTEVDKIEKVVGDALTDSGIDCTYDIEELDGE